MREVRPVSSDIENMVSEPVTKVHILLVDIASSAATFEQPIPMHA